MYTRLQNALEKILTPHKMSYQTSIFNDTIFKLAGVEIKKTNRNNAIGFYDNSYYSNKNDLTLPFAVPAINMEHDMPKLLNFLKQPKETYLMGEDLFISENIINDLLKIFENYINTMKNSDIELKSYILQSKTILEEKAINKIKEASANLIESTHIACGENELNGGQVIIIATLDHLLFLIKKLKDNPDTSIKIMEYKEKLKKFFYSHPEFEQDILFFKDINLLEEGFADYAKFNRTQSVLAAEIQKNHPERLKKYKDICVIKNSIENIDLLVDALTKHMKYNENEEVQNLISQLLNELSSCRILLNNYISQVRHLEKINFIHELLVFMNNYSNLFQLTNQFRNFGKDHENINKLSCNLLVSLSFCMKQINQDIFIACEDNKEDKMEEIGTYTQPITLTHNTPGTVLFPYQKSVILKDKDVVTSNFKPGYN